MTPTLPRCFVALLPDAPGRAALGALQQAARRLPDAPRARWTLAADLHLTLRFLGDCTPETLAAALAAVPLCPDELPFVLRCARLEAWPPARPRLLVARFEPDARLSTWVDAVERWAVGAGYDAERRGYVPHVTLARAARPWSSLPSPTLTAIGFDALAALHRHAAADGPRYAVHAQVALTARIECGGVLPAADATPDS